MSESQTNQENVFVSLQGLVKMESFAHGFSFLARKQKVRSIMAGRHASKLRGRGLDFDEVRQYVAGDDIRNIDWKVTARTKKVHTRLFKEEKEKPALIVVDQSKSMFFGSQMSMKSVVAAQLAALASFRVLKEGDRVGGIVFADNGIDIVFPRRDRQNVLRFLKKIVERNRELQESPPILFEEALKEVIGRIKNIVTHDFLVVIISDFLRYSPAVLKFISQIRKHNDVVAVKVFDPMEQYIPSERFTAGNNDKQISVDGGDNKIRKRFIDGFQHDFLVFETTLKKYKVPLLKINTVDPVDQQLKKLLTGSKE